MSNMSSDLELQLQKARAAFAEIQRPEVVPGAATALINQILTDESLWSAIDVFPTTSVESAAQHKQLQEVVFGLLRIAHVQANGELPLTNAPVHERLSRVIKNVLLAASQRSLKPLLPKPLPPEAQTLDRINSIRAHRDRLGLTINNALTPDGGVINPVLEAAQDDIVTHTRRGLGTIGIGHWETVLRQGLSELQHSDEQLRADTVLTEEALSVAEQQYLGTLSGLAVLNLRMAQLEGNVRYLDEALTYWSEYSQYLESRRANGLESAEYQRQRNSDRLKALTQQAMLGVITFPDLHIVRKRQVWRKARALRAE